MKVRTSQKLLQVKRLRIYLKSILQKTFKIETLNIKLESATFVGNKQLKYLYYNWKWYTVQNTIGICASLRTRWVCGESGKMSIGN